MRCDNCNRPRRERRSTPMLRTPVWYEAIQALGLDNPGARVVCRDCVEGALGRPLAFADLAYCAMNMDFIETREIEATPIQAKIMLEGTNACRRAQGFRRTRYRPGSWARAVADIS